MNDVVIRVESVSKQYRLGVISHGTLYRELQSKWAKVRKREDPNAKVDLISSGHNGHPGDRFWALKDISFEVRQGEILGIIGRNGAGKSTLLKILSQVTAPTKGTIKVKGRVASLLEVGTGFHPELTGRENVFLNGAILGMTKREIEQKFDEIVKFAEVDKFIDTPVKRYSSGMYVRLAFAVAAHLEPEILLVDEVLAVGDASFQKKCIGKMQNITEGGRTILFVSHNMAAISRICKRVILLHDGTIVKDGPPGQVISYYIKGDFGTQDEHIWDKKCPGNDIVRLRAVRVKNSEGTVSGIFDLQEDVCVEMEYDVLKPDSIFLSNFHFFNDRSDNIFTVGDFVSEWRNCPRPVGHYVTQCWVPGNLLNVGLYSVGVALSIPKPGASIFYERSVVTFDMRDMQDENPTRGDFSYGNPGIVRPLLKWETNYSPAN